MTGKVTTVSLNRNRVSVNVLWDNGDYTVGLPIVEGQRIPQVGEKVKYAQSRDRFYTMSVYDIDFLDYPVK